MTDKQLIQDIRAGDQRAFELVYERYYRLVFYLALKMLKKEDLAEDAVQDIFIRFWRYRENLKAEGSIKSFLMTISKNHLLNVIRDNKTQILKHLLLQDREEQPKNDTENVLYYKELNGIVHKGMEGLTKRKREIFALKVLQGYSNQEIAEKLSISPNTVKFQLSQAKKSVRSYVQNYMGTVLGFFMWL